MRRTRMKQRSDNRQEGDAAYRALSDQVRTEHHGACQLGPLIATADHSHRCIGIQQGLHHLRKQGQGGARILRANVMPSCNPCNDWVEDNPDDALDLGLVVLEGDPRWNDLGKRAERLAL